MDFCWNFCGEQQREGEQGTDYRVEMHRSETLKIETKKLFAHYTLHLGSNFQESIRVDRDTEVRNYLIKHFHQLICKQESGCSIHQKGQSNTFSGFQLRMVYLRQSRGTSKAVR